MASTAPGYSLAAVLGVIVAVQGIGLQAPAILLISFVPMALYSFLLVDWGSLILGAILMLLWARTHPAFLRTRPSVADPAVLAQPAAEPATG